MHIYNLVKGKPDLGEYQNRAGYGPRLPLMVISPYAKSNFVDHTLTDQSSILRFVEDNWNLGRIGDSSFDEKAGSIENMFDFASGPVNPKLFLDPITGQADSKYNVHVQLNGQQISFENPAMILNGKTLVPMKQMFELLGATVQWDENTRTVTAVKGDQSVSLQVDSDVATVNGKTVTLAQAPVIENGNVMVPVRLIGGAFGTKVEWNAADRSVTLTK